MVPNAAAAAAAAAAPPLPETASHCYVRLVIDETPPTDRSSADGYIYS